MNKDLRTYLHIQWPGTVSFGIVLCMVTDLLYPTLAGPVMSSLPDICRWIVRLLFAVIAVLLVLLYDKRVDEYKVSKGNIQYLLVNAFIGTKIVVVDTEDMQWCRLLDENNISYKVSKIYWHPLKEYIIMFLRIPTKSLQLMEKIGERVEDIQVLTDHRDFSAFKDETFAKLRG